MVNHEESRRTAEEFLPKNGLLPTEEMLEKYGAMSVEEQRVQFPKIINALKTRAAAGDERRVLFLMLLEFTKPTIILKHTPEKKVEKDDLNERITVVVNLFEDCIKKLNEIPSEKLFVFIDRMSRTEKDSADIFIGEMFNAFLEYPRKEDDDTSMIFSFMGYTNRYSQTLQQRKSWISEMVEDYRLGGRKSKARAVEERKEAFEKSTKKYKCSGWGFLVLTFVVASILILWGLQLAFNIFCFPIPNSENYFFIASSVVGKIIVSATLFFLLGAFSKSYFACKHNETICRQRHDVLSSYEDIYKVVDEKKFVLQKVAEAVFDQLPTGFSKLQTDKGDSSISLADIVNMVQKSSDKGQN